MLPLYSCIQLYVAIGCTLPITMQGNSDSACHVHIKLSLEQEQQHQQYAKWNPRHHSTEEATALILADPGVHAASDVNGDTMFWHRSNGSAQFSDRHKVKVWYTLTKGVRASQLHKTRTMSEEFFLQLL